VRKDCVLRRVFGENTHKLGLSKRVRVNKRRVLYASLYRLFFLFSRHKRRRSSSGGGLYQNQVSIVVICPATPLQYPVCLVRSELRLRTHTAATHGCPTGPILLPGVSTPPFTTFPRFTRFAARHVRHTSFAASTADATLRTPGARTDLDTPVVRHRVPRLRARGYLLCCLTPYALL